MRYGEERSEERSEQRSEQREASRENTRRERTRGEREHEAPTGAERCKLDVIGDAVRGPTGLGSEYRCVVLRYTRNGGGHVGVVMNYLAVAVQQAGGWHA